MFASGVPRVLVVAAIAGLAASGCVGDSGAPSDVGRDPSAPGAETESDALALEGIVVDPEFVPVEGVAVALPDLEASTLTDPGGRFRLSVPSPGDYLVVFQKDGYASLELGAFVAEGAENKLVVTLEPNSLEVPYHETHIHATYAQLWLSAGPAGIPVVGAVDYLAGTSLSQDKPTVLFDVLAPGLVEILVEISFQPQALGKEAIIVVREPGSIYSGAQKSWLLQFGPSPIRAQLLEGEVGVGGSHAFDATIGMKYMAMIGGWGSNSTIPTVAVHLDFRTQTHLNWFYNRPASPGFTSLPDQ